MQVIDNRNVYEPLVLTPRQQQVLETLKDKETEEYALSKWYLGALYTLDNPYNPDRISQAAQSLRELLEKLPRVVQGSDVQGGGSGFAEMRRSMYERILRDKKRHPEGWKDEKIDGHLDKTLRKIETYLERNQQPTRRQQIQKAVATLDPMVNRLDSKIQETKRNQLLNLWQRLEHFAHHNSKPDEEEFRKFLGELEKTVFDLLAPITAQDQREIQAILSRSDRSETDVERMFSLIERRGANFAFFFKHAAETADATWLPHLNDRNYFANPPSAQRNDDGWEIFPFWWPINYLAKIANQVPDDTIKIVQILPEVDNPNIYKEILEIALQLHSEQSAELKRQILKSTNINDQLLAYKYAELLAHWTAENQTSAALELTKVLVEFVPDVQSETKQKRRSENSADLGTFLETSLNPSPRIELRAYREMMSKGVCPLAEKEPYQTARLLTDATANMIRLRTHREELNQEVDSSEIWYERLDGLDTGHESPDKTLVHTLIFACKQVYEKSPDSVVALDKFLRDQQWGVFKRLRQHLYAQFPNERTQPWIRELILEHKEYHLWEHRYEFQRMIQSACEHFGVSLLTVVKRTQIFDAILSGGPSKADFQNRMGDKFTEEGFQQDKRDFHRKQFKPFESLLFGEYATYFQELEAATNNPISDEDYPPLKTRGGYVSNRSPRSPEDLANFTDEKLLTYINEWEENEFFSEGNSFIEIDIEGLAGAFQIVFKETIIPNANRLRFWLENREKIERPIYVRMMLNGMQTEVKEKNFDRLNMWLTFGEWMLSHPDQEHEGDYRLGKQGDESRENPDWQNSRRAVGDFIEACLKEEVNVPIPAREQLARLLEMFCTQFDSGLDNDEQTFPGHNNLLNEGFNNTRSRALQTLVGFALWLREHDSASGVPEVITILEKRFTPQAEYSVTLPEYAILGMLYLGIFNLNKEWAIEHKSDFFPQDKLPEWLAAFSSFICSNNPHKLTFEIFLNDFDFALQHIADCTEQDHTEEEWIDTLGQHLFTYYLWGLYPLRGSAETNDCCSPLERYYQATDNNPEHWANLFYYVGDTLWTTEQLDRELKDRIIAFFDWRFEVKEPTELQQFTLWLEAECLDAEWRLEAYSKILDVCKEEGVSIDIQVEVLYKMLPNHTARVIECFTKLTDGIKDNNIDILAEEAKTILKAGLNSSDERVRQNAERARENLLRKGKFDLLDLDD